MRRATQTDVDAICEIGRAAWPGTYAFAGQDFVEHGLATWWSAAAVERGLATTTTLVAESEGHVVGVGNVDLRPDPPVIWKLYVHPGHQGEGVGSSLLTALIGVVPAARGTVAIEYIDGNARAAAVYARHGFVEVRRDPADRPDWPRQVWAELLLADS
ncbi:GNAT family N-acetyltransferase [Angustibacter sp. McL0619]|uniref:GNAT family N-acetyltransferase n=1 Tax=Angustibacter sp. McL0619 TaxID=3415676 RepID=UPI003CF73CF2